MLNRLYFKNELLNMVPSVNKKKAEQGTLRAQPKQDWGVRRVSLLEVKLNSQKKKLLAKNLNTWTDIKYIMSLHLFWYICQHLVCLQNSNRRQNYFVVCALFFVLLLIFSLYWLRQKCATSVIQFSVRLISCCVQYSNCSIKVL